MLVDDYLERFLECRPRDDANRVYRPQTTHGQLSNIKEYIDEFGFSTYFRGMKMRQRRL
jgi:hypothetical protein